MSGSEEVIDWAGAMEQCGDDEEFLRELLADLRTETEAQLVSIAQTIQTPSDSPYHRIMRAAHVVKGAAANLMCGQLRVAAAELEKAASAAHEAGGTSAPAPAQSAVQAGYASLQKAAQAYVMYLQSIGV